MRISNITRHIKKRTPRKYDTIEKEAILRIKNKYLCPICSRDDEHHIHTIKSKNSRKCLDDCFHRPNHFDYKLEDIGYTVCRYCHIYTRNYDIWNHIRYKRKKYSVIIPDILIDFDLLMEEKSNSERNIEVLSDYWIHPKEAKEKIDAEITSIQVEFAKKESDLYNRAMIHRIPGMIWKDPGDYVSSGDPECKFLKLESRSFGSINMAIWDGDYVKEILIGQDFITQGYNVSLQKIRAAIKEQRIKQWLKEWETNHADTSDENE